MTLSSDNATAPSAPSRTTTQSFYIAAWRWHFYAGLYVVPFLIILAVTGLGVVFLAVIDGRDGEKIRVTPGSASCWSRQGFICGGHAETPA